MSIPCGMVDGLPVGMMLVGKLLDEATIYRAAAAFERGAGLEDHQGLRSSTNPAAPPRPGSCCNRYTNGVCIATIHVFRFRLYKDVDADLRRHDVGRLPQVNTQGR